jgi:hemerythrin superfamily protein
MNAIDVLKAQHREVEKLFDKLDKSQQPAEKERLFQELAGKLVGHDAIEREVFYPACEDAMGLSDLLGEALVEHGVVEFCLYQADQAIGKPDFDFKVKVLKELVEHHVKEEEHEFFPKVQKAFEADELEDLAEELEDAFAEATSDDYHAPLFENLRQVLAGTLQPVSAKDLGEDEDEERPSTNRRSVKRRQSA